MTLRILVWNVKGTDAKASTAALAGYFWHMPDQVLIRFELAAHLGELSIIDQIDSELLVSKDARRPDFEVVAELDTRVSGELLEHAFYLLSDKVGYRHLLFRAPRRLGFPVTLYDRAGDEGKSLTPFGPPQQAQTEAQTECNTSAELEQALKQLFEHPDTQRIVGQLRNLSREAS